MKKIELNKVIEGTTLVPIKREKGGMLRCVCNVCGMGREQSDHIVNMLYRESYLKENAQECRYCASLKQADKDGLLGCKNEVDILLAQEKRIEQGNLSSIRQGQNYIDTEVKGSIKEFPLNVDLGELKVLGYIGQWGDRGHLNKPTKVALRCPVCKYSRIESLCKTTYSKKYSCPFCSKNRVKVSKEKAKRIVSAKQSQEKAKEKQIEKLKDVPFSKKKSFRDRLKDGAKFDAYLEKIKELNPNYVIADVRREGYGYITDMICTKCGSHISVSNTNRSKAKECEGCKKKESDINYQGAYQRNYLNSVYNRLEIISQNNLECDVRCTCCGKEQQGLDLYGVVNKQYYCDCPNAIIEIVCSNENCGYIVEVKIADIVNENLSKYTCSACGESLIKEEVENEMFLEDNKVSLRKRLKASGGVLGKVVATRNSLTKETIPVYAGTDGEYYYRCRCMTHNKDLVLNNSEIENYNHELCNDGRHKLIDKVDADNLKL